MLIKRLQILWHHSREIRVRTTQNTITYSIPLYQDLYEVAQPLRVTNRNGFLEVVCARKEVKIDPVSREPEGLKN